MTAAAGDLVGSRAGRPVPRAVPYRADDAWVAFPAEHFLLVYEATYVMNIFAVTYRRRRSREFMKPKGLRHGRGRRKMRSERGHAGRGVRTRATGTAERRRGG